MISINFDLHGLPTKAYYFEEKGESGIVFLLGNPTKDESINVRVHSACSFSEIFGSRDCDCKEQMMMFIDLMKKEGKGVLIYLFQEGRGAGLKTKFEAYNLSQQYGLDTVEAFQKLGIELDVRNYLPAVSVLKKIIKTRNIILHTNNKRKIRPFIQNGFIIDRSPLLAEGLSENASSYLKIKQCKLGHLGNSNDEILLTNSVFIGNGWGNNFVKKDVLSDYLCKLSFNEVNSKYEFYLPFCNFFYGDLERFSKHFSLKNITGIFGFAPNGLLHLGHLSVILTYIKLGVNNLIFSANDYESRFIRNLLDNDQMETNCNFIFELGKCISDKYNIDYSFEIRTKSLEIVTIFEQIKDLTTLNDVVNIFGEDIGKMKTDAMNWQAAAYVYHSLNNDYVIGISGIDELVPMMRVDFIAKKMNVSNWGGFYIKDQIPSIDNSVKMSKSMSATNNNITHKETYDLFESKIKILSEKNEGLNAIKQIFNLINNDESTEFSIEAFLNLFVCFSKSTRFLII